MARRDTLRTVMVSAITAFATTLVTLGGLYLLLGPIASWSATRNAYRVKVYLDDLQGLQPGSPVRMHGVRIGYVNGTGNAGSVAKGKPVYAELSIGRRYTLFQSDRFEAVPNPFSGSYVRVTERSKSHTALDKDHLSVVQGSSP